MINKELLILLFLIVLSCAIGFLSLTNGHNWGGDFSAYIMQAKSIVDGEMALFIEHNSLTASGTTTFDLPITYPWGYPLLIAPVIYELGINLFAIKLVNILFFALFLITVYCLFRQRLSFLLTTLLVSIFAFNPIIFWQIDQILSDIPYLFFSILSIYMIDRVYGPKSDKTQTVAGNIFLGFIIFYSFFTRANGILLFAPLLYCQLLEHYNNKLSTNVDNNRNYAMYTLPYVTFFISVGCTSIIFPDGAATGSYLGYLRDLSLLKLENNLYYYLNLSATFFGESRIHHALHVVLTLFALIGVIVSSRKEGHFVVYASLTLLLNLILPWLQGIRYILPILPFYIYFGFKGILTTIEFKRGFSKVGYRVISMCFCIFIGLMLKNSLSIANANQQNNRETQGGAFHKDSTETFQYISTYTDPISVIAFFKPRVARMITNRDSISIDNCVDLKKVDFYIYVKSITKSYQVPLEKIGSCKEHIKLTWKFGNANFTVYEIGKD